MANKKLIVSQDKITAVADAIREKTSTTDTMTLDEMPGKISSISGGGSYTKTKLPDPIWYLDYENNKLHIYQEQLIRMFGAEEWIKLTDNDVEVPWTDFSQYYTVNNGIMGNNSNRNIGQQSLIADTSNIEVQYYNGPNYSVRYSNGAYSSGGNSASGGSIYDIPLVKGKHVFKIQYKAANCSSSTPIIYKESWNPNINTIGLANFPSASTSWKSVATITDNPFTDSNVITLPDYTINEYNLDLSNVKYDSSITGLLPSLLSLSGNLYTYNKSIAYTFDTSKAGNGITSTSSYYKIANIDGDNIISNFTGVEWNNTNYVKISFTLTEAKNISINYIFNKTSTDYRYDGIWFGAIDKTMSITFNGYDSKSSITNCIYYAGDGSGADEKISINDTSVHTYTYENVPAGEHYIQLRLYGYRYDDSYQPKITVTPVYDKIDTGKYLPSTITVTNADTGETLTDYAYDPYTGKFTIPMTHSWNMTAVASTLKNILDKVSYNMSYDTGIMTLSSTGATSYTYNIDNGEETTTTTGNIDLTSLSDKAVHTITSMASADGSRPSVKNSYKVYKNMSGEYTGTIVKQQDFLPNSSDHDNTFACMYNNNPTIFCSTYNNGKGGEEVFDIFTKKKLSSYEWSGYIYTTRYFDIYSNSYTGNSNTTRYIINGYHVNVIQLGKYIVALTSGNSAAGSSVYGVNTKYIYIIDPINISSSTSFYIDQHNGRTVMLYPYKLQVDKNALYIYGYLDGKLSILKLTIDDSKKPLDISIEIIAQGAKTFDSEKYFPKYVYGINSVLFTNVNTDNNTFDVRAVYKIAPTSSGEECRGSVYIGKNLTVNSDTSSFDTYEEYSLTFPAKTGISYAYYNQGNYIGIYDNYIMMPCKKDGVGYIGLIFPYTINDDTKTIVIDDEHAAEISPVYKFIDGHSSTNMIAYNDYYRGNIFLFNQGIRLEQYKTAYAFY